MKNFVQLFTQLEQSTKTNKKVAALKQYFDAAGEEDRLWTIALLSHRRPKRMVKTALLKKLAAEVAQLPYWLFEESYHIVGDLAETMALIYPNTESKQNHSLTYWIEYLIALRPLEEAEKEAKIIAAWEQMDEKERFVFNKIITGGWRIGISQKLMCRALAQHCQIDENVLALRLMGNWSAESTTFQKLVIEPDAHEQIAQPYPFYLAYALEEKSAPIESSKDWLAEYKWDGIRAQVIVRENQLFLWSRGEELITESFPDLHRLKEDLADGTVIDGELVAFKDGKIQNFNQLQQRLGRKTVSAKLREQIPVAIIAYDLLEYQGKDIREKSMMERRNFLEKVVENAASEVLRISPLLKFNQWEDLVDYRNQSRQNLAEGLMLKRKDSSYQVGRKKGAWWKWKVDPLTIDAVLIYAMRGHGRRSNLYTDYTFAVWKGKELVPFTKAYSGLSDAELRKVDAFVKKNTLDRFGPVRSVKAELVFEIAFEGIAASKRHKSGIAVRFPRIHRWRKDKKVEDVNSLDDLNRMLYQFSL